MMQKTNILLIEDSPGDIRLTQEAFRESRMQNNLHIAMDGVEALDFLNKRGENSNAPTPDIILLDLNLPRKNGFEVLREIKESEVLRVIPVVMLTTSQSEQDILMSYKMHANSFVSKPVEFDSFLDIVRRIEDFWFTIVRFPKR